MAGTYDFTVSVASFGEFADPAEAVRQKPGFLKSAVDGAHPAMEHYFRRYLAGNSLKTVDKRKKAIRLVLSKVKNIWSPVERSHWLRELSHQAGVPERELSAEMDQLGQDEGRQSPVEIKGEKRKLERQELVALRILGLIALKPDLAPLCKPYLELMPLPYREAHGLIVGQHIPSSELQASNEEVREIVNFASLRSGVEFVDFEEGQLEIELKNLLRELQYEHLKQLRDKTGRLVLRAEQTGDEKELLEQLTQLDGIVKKLHNLKNTQNAKEEVKEKETQKNR